MFHVKQKNSPLRGCRSIDRRYFQSIANRAELTDTICIKPTHEHFCNLLAAHRVRSRLDTGTQARYNVLTNIRDGFHGLHDAVNV